MKFLMFAVLAMGSFAQAQSQQVHYPIDPITPPRTIKVQVQVEEITQWDNQMPVLGEREGSTIITIVKASYSACNDYSEDQVLISTTAYNPGMPPEMKIVVPDSKCGAGQVPQKREIQLRPLLPIVPSVKVDGQGIVPVKNLGVVS